MIELPFDEADIQRCLPDTYARRGQAYQRDGRVRELRIAEDGMRLAAAVQGSRSRPYRVEIRIGGDGRGRVSLDSRCTCPLGFNCKHVAAVLFQAIRDTPIPVPLRPGRSPAPEPAANWPAPPRRRTSVPQPAPDPLAGPVGAWLDDLAHAVAPPVPEGLAGGERLVYRLDVIERGLQAVLALGAQVVRPLKSGGYGQGREWNPDNLATSSARFVSAEDHAIGRLLATSAYSFPAGLSSDPDIADLLLRRLIATGRCHWRSKENPPLSQGQARPGRLGWHLTVDGRQVPRLEAGDEGLVALPGAAPWYVDPERHEAGPLDCGLPIRLVRALLHAPPVAPEQAARLGAALAERLPGVAIPPPRPDIVEEIRDAPPTPHLRLVTVELPVPRYSWYRNADMDTRSDLALLRFDYAGTLVAPAVAPPELRSVLGHRVVVRRRHPKIEKAAFARLLALGLEAAVPVGEIDAAAGSAFALAAGETGWPRFLHREVPALRAEGWRVEIDPEFRHRLIDATGEWQAELTETGGGWWFSLDLGIEVEGERLALLPVLVSALARLRDPGAPGAIEQLAVDGTVYGRLPDGRAVALPLDRVRAILATLVELYDGSALNGDGTLQLSLGAAAGFAAVEMATQMRWLGGERLRSLAERLAGFAGVAPVAAPEGLRAELRPYQRDGLSWLQFLGGYGLGGILADDMGLGKTVQALAHLLAEKRAGRLDRPALVLCPTSVVPNWQAEAERFAPELKVLALRGPDRAARFGDIAGADLVISTYPLLIRDADTLVDQDWHVVILDEAQAIKNPQAKVTQLACRLKARHRLCLTGTPIENHLGELWSHVAFLMPGLLGDHRRFTRLFRTPIEKKGDAERGALLSARLRPFVLRRTKAEVASELPPKTEIVRRVELGGEQRDLYETLRLAMHDKVRQAVAMRGLARSRIIILDALLKLRQACCDPRLVKLAAARKVRASAKLDDLFDMLGELVAEGRRVLVFSQFTSMLDLIMPRLDEAAIPFVELRGDTVDRAAPVRRFQAGEVPVFLISLKAGGTGLNLTAADTVIHYDPWWNPAVEAQATDRAYRIGQDKPVFVYKLIATGTVEERILDLQERKRGLAEVLFDPERRGSIDIDAAELELLFQPMA